METFLSSVAKDVTSKHKNFLELVFIVPGKRAATFLQKELLSITTQTTFAPKIISIEDFVQELSNINLATNLHLLFEFYEAYKELYKNTDGLDDFQSFSKWAQILLQDFNEIDRYLIPHEQIFSYLSSVKDLDHWSKQDNKTEIQENYLKFWGQLNKYYTIFSQRLLEKKIGYQGLIYREAIENIEFYLQSNNKHHVFVGFNALNTAEERIIQEFLHTNLASIYWDVDEMFLNDTEHDAGLFMRRYKKDWKIFNTSPFEKITNNYSSEKNIQIIGIPKNVGQAKYTGHILSKASTSSLGSTAVILGNESLLGAVLNSIPKNIDKVNITCGYKLQDTPLASFFSILFDILTPQKYNTWYYKNVINFLTHPIAKPLFSYNNIDYSRKITQHIQEKNIVQVSINTIFELLPNELHESILLIFTDKKTTISENIENIISIILNIKEKTDNDLYLEYLFRFYEVFNQLQAFNNTYKSITSTSDLKNVYNELLTKETVDFKGEPLEGLQIMGVLESRNLDYETVIITSVNEGILPAGKSNNSFLPFDAKLAYGLPTHKEKDAVYTYHFYRLLQRAKNIYLLYNTEPDVLEGGEKSRFIRQILHQNLPNHSIKEIIASPEVHFERTPIQEINKNDLLLNKLKEIASKGFSPSSLTNYIRNPIDFYKQSVLGIRDVDEVEETLAANSLGTIVHDTLMDLYQPFEGEYLTLDVIEGMKKRINEIITTHFEKVYKGGDFSKGKNLISFHVAKRYIENFLKFEKNRLKQGKQIKIIKIESDLKVKIEIPELQFPVYIRGKVDRVEEVDGVINIIDYKTGKVDQKDVEIVNWEDVTADYKYSKAFQILCYAYMIEGEFSQKQIEAGIISFKNLQSGFLKFAKKDKSGRGAVKETIIDLETFTNYTTELKKLILEICNPRIPFTEKEIELHTHP